MKYVKMLGLLAVAAAALMAFASAASAATITSSTGETPTIHTASVGKISMHNAIGTIACESTMSVTIESHGAVFPAQGNISTLSYNNCTGGTFHSDFSGMVSTPGALIIHGKSPTGNGTVTRTGSIITVTMLGVQCGYSTNSTHIGELVAGEHARLVMSGALIPRTHGSSFCGANATLTGEYRFNHPTYFQVH